MSLRAYDKRRRARLVPTPRPRPALPRARHPRARVDEEAEMPPKIVRLLEGDRARGTATVEKAHVSACVGSQPASSGFDPWQRTPPVVQSVPQYL